MKKVLVVLALILAINIYADFSQIQPIFDNQALSFAADESMAIDDENIYFTFWADNAIRLAVSVNSGASFDYFTVAETELDQQPVLALDDQSDLHIFFQQAATLQQATTSDNGASFQQTTFLDMPGNVHSASYVNGSLQVLYSQNFSNTLSRYQYFTDFEASINADGGTESGIVAFWGQDVLYGPVHSNDDIWILQAGGGDNDGWPTFYGQVTTSGIFRHHPTGEPLIGSGAPIDQIFRDSYGQEVPEKPFDHTLTEIRENGENLVLPSTDLAVVELNGSSYTIHMGDIVEIGTQEFPVYSWYPTDAQQVNEIIAEGGNWFEDSEIIYTNQITLYDTIWTTSSGNASNQTFWVDCDLYISGEVSGSQTWGCSGDAYLLGDITYSNTAVGEHPDGFIGFDEYGEPEYDESSINTFDYFALASENKVKIAYKFRMEDEGEITFYDNNSGGIILYGLYAALAEGNEDIYGDMACHYDGVFTFDYQHPHGSTPNFVAPSPYSGNDTLYTFVDLHKYIFPPHPYIEDELQVFNLQSNGVLGNGSGYTYPDEMAGFPYDSSQNPGAYANSYPNLGPDYTGPDGTDWPWYNPVWPESAETVSDNLWFEDRNATVYGSIIQRRRGFMRRSGLDPYNHPQPPITDPEAYHYGGTHAPTGFDKDYYYDQRLNFYDFPNFPSAPNSDPLYLTNIGEYSETSFLSTYDLENCLTFNNQEEIYYLLQTTFEAEYQTKIYTLTDDNYPVMLLETTELDTISTFQKIDDIFYLLEKDASNSELFNLLSWQPEIGFSSILSLPPNSLLANSSTIESDLVLLTADTDNYLNFFYDFDYNQFAAEYNWQTPFANNLQQIALQYSGGKIHLLAQEQETATTTYLQGDWNGFLPTGEAPELHLAYQLENYPNPFNPSTTISFQANAAENVRIEIYNIKGQIVRSIDQKNQPYQINEVVWDGKDQSGKAISSGVYMYRLVADEKNVLSNKMLLMK
ncbi:MAG: FlgD immunoglobulin-like domain containing protein [Candidatus Cloacimonadales bacterium]